MSGCLSICVSWHHVHMSACIDLKFYIQPHSDTGKVFTSFLTHTALPNQCIYAKN